LKGPSVPRRAINSVFLRIKEHADGRVAGKCGNSDSAMDIEKGERVTAEVVPWECFSGGTTCRALHPEGQVPGD
jgi:hypothetical protein